MTTGLYEYLFNKTNSGIGNTFYYQVEAADEKNNIDTSSWLFVDITDKVSPVVNSINLKDYGNGTILVVANVTDNLDVSVVEVWWNGTIFSMTRNVTTPDLWYWINNSVPYNEFINVTVFQTTDSVGNVNNYFNSPTGNFITWTATDTIAPTLVDLYDTINSHNKGNAWFYVNATDAIYGSGLNLTSFYLYLRINGTTTTSLNLLHDTGARYSINYTFGINDTVEYWVNVSDNAGNQASLTASVSPKIITDIIPPEGQINATDYGNGTIYFNATVTDWPSAAETILLYYSTNLVSWNKVPMNATSSTHFDATIKNIGSPGFPLYYQVVANDSAGNLLNVNTNDELTSYNSIVLKDTAAPKISLFWESDSKIEGLITFKATVTDQWGSLPNPEPPIELNITMNSQTNIVTEMSKDQLGVWSYQSLFPYGTTLNVEASTYDSASNIGKTTLVLTVNDTIAPTIASSGVEIKSAGKILAWAIVVDGDYGSGIKQVNVSIDQENYVMPFNGTHYIKELTGFRALQAINLQFIAEDNAKNLIQSTLQDVYIDTVAPEIEMIGHTDFGNGTVLLYANVTDDMGTVSAVTFGYQLNNNNTTEITASFNSTLWIATINVNWNTLVNYTILRASDPSGLAENTSLANDYQRGFVTTDTVSPYVNFTQDSIEDYQNSSVGIFVEANDHTQWQSGLKKVELTINFNETTLFVTMKEYSNDVWFYILDGLRYDQFIQFSVTVTDNADNKVTQNQTFQMADNTPPQVLDAGLTDYGNGTLVFWANVTDYGSGIASVILQYALLNQQASNQSLMPNTQAYFKQNDRLNYYNGYSINFFRLMTIQGNVQTNWENSTMTFNGSLYVTTVDVVPGKEIEWRIITIDKNNLTNPLAYVSSQPYRVSLIKETPFPWPLLLAIISILVIISAVAVVKLRKTEVIGIDKEKIKKHLNEIENIKVRAAINEHTLGFIICYFDQKEGPIPVFAMPEFLMDNINVMLSLADRSFSVSGFVDPKEILTVEFDYKIVETPSRVFTWAMAVANPQARGGKENFTLNLLVLPEYTELVRFFIKELEPALKKLQDEIREIQLNNKDINLKASVYKLRETITRYILATYEYYTPEEIVEFFTAEEN